MNQCRMVIADYGLIERGIQPVGAPLTQDSCFVDGQSYEVMIPDNPEDAEIAEQLKYFKF